jgi:NAD(P)-dependent dehydrogenase (short-subunit alcohol dehydrogenase family)
MSWSACNLAGKTALVIGGNSGIGRAAAEALSNVGASVIIGYGHRESEAYAVSQQLQLVPGASTAIVSCNVADIDDVKSALATVHAKFGSVDIVVNAAGITEFVPIMDLNAITVDMWNRILHTNVIGAWNVGQSARSYLQDSEVGNLVFVGSIAGLTPSGSSIPYAVSKAALHHLAKLLAKAYSPRARVNVVAPGTIDTPWMEGHEEMIAASRANALLKRAGQPSEVADAILFLATTRYATGSVLVVDGGLSLG